MNKHSAFIFFDKDQIFYIFGKPEKKEFQANSGLVEYESDPIHPI
jgi:hypothetical protein